MLLTMSISQLLDPITAQGGPLNLPGATRWMQGRTLYGGASALIAYIAAVRAFPDLPPLRAGQIAFIAPIGAEMETRVELIRQGRNVVQLRSEILCGRSLALTAFWLFGTGREPNACFSAKAADGALGAPEDGALAATGSAPAFLQNNYEVRHTADRTEEGCPLIRQWIRLREPSGLEPIAELILVGDTLPPSALRLAQRPGPLSSINWSFNVLDPEPATRDGWWLAETASDHADHGYSSERLRLWNSDGQPMMAGMQNVAIFG